MLVVADGVGGWGQRGIDPGAYSKTLCLLIGNIYDRNNSYYQERPEELLKLSVSKNQLPGTCTITVVTLNEVSGKIKIAYMGDSLLSIYSDGSKKFKTTDHSRAFNQPYQVGV